MSLRLHPSAIILPMSTTLPRLVVTTDRASVVSDFGQMLANAGSPSVFEDASRRDGVPRHVAREMGRRIAIEHIGDGEHMLGNGWWMTVEGDQVELRLGRGEPA